MQFDRSAVGCRLVGGHNPSFIAIIDYFQVWSEEGYCLFVELNQGCTKKELLIKSASFIVSTVVCIAAHCFLTLPFAALHSPPFHSVVFLVLSLQALHDCLFFTFTLGISCLPLGHLSHAEASPTTCTSMQLPQPPPPHTRTHTHTYIYSKPYTYRV